MTKTWLFSFILVVGCIAVMFFALPPANKSYTISISGGRIYYCDYHAWHGADLYLSGCGRPDKEHVIQHAANVTIKEH